MADSETSFKTLIQDLINQVTALIRQELRLAQAESVQKVQQGLRGLIVMIAGLLFVFLSLIIFTQAAVAALATAMPLWMASLVVGGGCLFAGLLIYAIGRRMISLRRLTPERTLRSLRDDKEQVRENVR